MGRGKGGGELELGNWAGGGEHEKGTPGLRNQAVVMRMIVIVWLSLCVTGCVTVVYLYSCHCVASGVSVWCVCVYVSFGCRCVAVIVGITLKMCV